MNPIGIDIALSQCYDLLSRYYKRPSDHLIYQAIDLFADPNFIPLAVYEAYEHWLRYNAPLDEAKKEYANIKNLLLVKARRYYEQHT